MNDGATRKPLPAETLACEVNPMPPKLAEMSVVLPPPSSEKASKSRENFRVSPSPTLSQVMPVPSVARAAADLLVWGMQGESYASTTDLYPTSYIPVTTVPLDRALEAPPYFALADGISFGSMAVTVSPPAPTMAAAPVAAVTMPFGWPVPVPVVKCWFMMRPMRSRTR